MITEKQREARRRNGRLSRGPKTAAGKARVSQNALKYGVYASDPLLPGESAKQFEKFREELMKSLQPAGFIQQQAAEQVVAGFWKVRRFPAVEAEVFTKRMKEAVRDGVRPEHALGAVFMRNGKELDQLIRGEVMLDRMIHRNMAILQNKPTKIRTSRGESRGSAKTAVSSFSG